jgi:hypothetical protein
MALHLLLVRPASATRASSPANQWLSDHPLVLGLMFLAVGLVFAWTALKEARTGVVHDRHGKVVEGFLGVLWFWQHVLLAAGCSLFGLYNILFG